jgi:hypothetical protein
MQASVPVLKCMKVDEYMPDPDYCNETAQYERIRGRSEGTRGFLLRILAFLGDESCLA